MKLEDINWYFGVFEAFLVHICEASSGQLLVWTTDVTGACECVLYRTISFVVVCC